MTPSLWCINTASFRDAADDLIGAWAVPGNKNPVRARIGLCGVDASTIGIEAKVDGNGASGSFEQVGDLACRRHCVRRGDSENGEWHGHEDREEAGEELHDCELA